MSAGRSVGLLLGVAADMTLGDPRRGHPVAAFEESSRVIERYLYRDRRSAGVVHTGVLVGGAVCIGVLADRVARRSLVLEAATTAVTTWIVLGGSSLADEGTAMAGLLDAGDLDAARRWLCRLDGRDLDGRASAELDTQGLARASVESIAENTSGAVVAPLVWGAFAGIPGLLGYRAVNTLDAMIGHRDQRYRNFGWSAAQLDNLANLLPSRMAALLTAACAPVVGGSAGSAWRTWRRDATAHPSPNAGQIEAAFAGALQIRLGGRTIYAPVVEQLPVLGEGRTADAGDITRSVELSRVLGLVTGLITAGAALIAVSPLGRFGRRG